jgi:hypothetical protein
MLNKKFTPVLLILLALVMIIWSYRGLSMVYGDRRFIGYVYGQDSEIAKNVVKSNRAGIAIAVIVLILGVFLLIRNGKKLLTN